MKSSHYTTPRTLSEAHFDPRGQALWHFGERSQTVGDVLFAVALGIVGAVGLVYALAGAA